MPLTSHHSWDDIISWMGNNKGKTAGIVALGSLIVHNLSLRIYRKIKRYPPGPIPLPFVGLIPLIVWHSIFAPKDEQGDFRA